MDKPDHSIAFYGSAAVLSINNGETLGFLGSAAQNATDDPFVPLAVSREFGQARLDFSPPTDDGSIAQFFDCG